MTEVGGRIRSAQFLVDGTAVLLGVGNGGGSEIHFHADNNNSKDVLIGNADLTAANGFLLQKGDEFQMYLPEGAKVYGVSSDGTNQKVYVLQTGGI
jgi:hypothetical protein